MDCLWVRTIGAEILVGAGLLLIFGLYKQPYGEGLNALPTAVLVATWPVAYFGAGYLVGKWWFVPLMLIPIAIAIPTGSITADDDQMPVYLAMAASTVVFLGPFGILGVAARKLRDRHRSRTPFGGLGTLLRTQTTKRWLGRLPDRD